MKLAVFSFLTLVMISCGKPTSIDYTKINDITNIDKKVIKDFYEKVLDTIIKDCFLMNEPIEKLDLSPLENYHPKVIEENSEFFKMQVDNFKALKWKTILNKKEIVNKSEYDSIIFIAGYENGWNTIQEIYDVECICSISVPIFTKDFKKIYIDYMIEEKSFGMRRIFEYELRNSKWIRTEWN